MDVKDGLVAIASEVLSDVQKEAEAIILRAQEEAKKTLQTAKAQADQQYASLVNQAKIEAEGERRRIASVTEVEMRNQLLQTKEEIVDAAFKKAYSQLSEFSKTMRYHDYLLRRIGDDAKKVGSKKITVQINAADAAWLTPDAFKALSQKLQVDLKPADQNGEFLGGFKMLSQDRKITYDDTFDNRLQELKSNLRIVVAKTLFEGESS